MNTLVPPPWIPQAWLDWVLVDPQGQRAAVGLGLILFLVGLFATKIVWKKLTRRKKRPSHLPALGLMAFAVFYACVWAFDLSTHDWPMAAIVGLGTAGGMYLFARERGPAKAKGKGKPVAA